LLTLTLFIKISRFLRDIENKTPTIRVTPATGRALVNIHSTLHEGSRVESGTKYVIRTDILFQRRAKQHPKLKKEPIPSSLPFIGEWDKEFEPSCKDYHD
jgi:hypothetical protein